ncbi:hypothetical protein ACFC26_41280 [Kitasatospora purpeofusca]|uniref:hypothetical protein n=1 Tax=Kitasatospora purpeofusca TaxID=67352 RepID=UPI0035DCD765
MTRVQEAEYALDRLVRYVDQFGGEYSARWSPEHRRAWVAAVADMVHHPDRSRSFGPNTPVPDWARAEFDGRLREGESPTLTLGKVPGPVDWPRIVREHPVQLENGYYDQAPDGAAIVEAHELLTAAGFEPWMDTEIILAGVAYDGTLRLRLDAGAIHAEGEIERALVAAVHRVLGEQTRVTTDHHGPRGGRITEWWWY